MPTSRPAAGPATRVAEPGLSAAGLAEITAGHELAAVLTGLVGETDLDLLHRVLVQGARWLTGAPAATLELLPSPEPHSAGPGPYVLRAQAVEDAGADDLVTGTAGRGAGRGVPLLLAGRPYALLAVEPDTAQAQALLGVLAVAGSKAISAAQADETARRRQQATAAAVTIALARERRLAVEDERDRLAQDLHDSAMQRIFAAGLRLHSLVGGLPAGVAAEITAVVDELDGTVHDVRAMITSLRAMDLEPPPEKTP